jgi:hypothetical protein
MEAAIRILYALKCTAGSVDIGKSNLASCAEFCWMVSLAAFNSSSGFAGSGAGACASKTAEVESVATRARRVNFVSRFSFLVIGSVDIWDYYSSSQDQNEKRETRNE